MIYSFCISFFAFLFLIFWAWETAKKWKELNEDHFHYFIQDKDILTSGDGFDFVVCVEWEKSNIINVLGIAKALGWTFEIRKD